MKLYLYLLILFLGSGNLLFGQKNITGTVTDAKTGQPIGSVNLSAEKGKATTATNQNGQFSITINRMPATIKFTHIAYESNSAIISKYPEEPLEITLEPKVKSIKEVLIEGGKYNQVLRRENFYVSDYEFDQDKMWVVGYADKSILKPQLILLDLNGNIIEKKPAEGRTKLFKDALGWVHLMDAKSMVSVEFRNQEIKIGEPRDFSGWEQNLFDLQLVLGKNGIFKWVYNNGIYEEYVLVDFSDTVAIPTVIHQSYDREKFGGGAPAKTFRHSSIPDIPSGVWGVEFNWDDYTPFLNRAQEQLDYRPILTHLYRYRNNFLIFEDRGYNLWKYDLTFMNPEKMMIVVPKNAKNPDLLQDPVTGGLYLYYTLSGYAYLANIDPFTGATQYTRKIENFMWIDHLRVYNNRVWFTNQGVNGSAMMNLYSTELTGN
jgi:hypothetical protein